MKSLKLSSVFLVVLVVLSLLSFFVSKKMFKKIRMRSNLSDGPVDVSVNDDTETFTNKEINFIEIEECAHGIGN